MEPEIVSMGKTKRPAAAARPDQKSTKHQTRQNKHNRRTLHQLKISEKDPDGSSLPTPDKGICKSGIQCSPASSLHFIMSFNLIGLHCRKEFHLVSQPAYFDVMKDILKINGWDTRQNSYHIAH